MRPLRLFCLSIAVLLSLAACVTTSASDPATRQAVGAIVYRGLGGLTLTQKAEDLRTELRQTVFDPAFNLEPEVQADILNDIDAHFPQLVEDLELAFTEVFLKYFTADEIQELGRLAHDGDKAALAASPIMEKGRAAGEGLARDMGEAGARVGVNWVDGIRERLVAKYGYDPTG